MRQGKALQAVDTLNLVGPLDWAAPDALAISSLFPAYARGRAYLAAGGGNKAAAEFQKLINHPGMVLNFPLGALAHLGVARARRLAHQDIAARKEYQAFFALWKDADPDILILRQAKREFQSLQTSTLKSPESLAS